MQGDPLVRGEFEQEVHDARRLIHGEDGIGRVFEASEGLPRDGPVIECERCHGVLRCDPRRS